jgi:hypothetical protein
MSSTYKLKCRNLSSKYSDPQVFDEGDVPCHVKIKIHKVVTEIFIFVIFVFAVFVKFVFVVWRFFLKMPVVVVVRKPLAGSDSSLTKSLSHK